MRLLASAPTHHIHQQHCPSIPSSSHMEVQMPSNRRAIPGLSRPAATDPDDESHCELLSSSAPASGSDSALHAYDLLRQLFPDSQPPPRDSSSHSSTAYSIQIYSTVLCTGILSLQ